MNVKCGFWVYRRRSRRLPSTNSCTPQDRNSTLCPKEIGFWGRTRAGKCFSGASKLCENDRRGARARTTRSEEGLTQQTLQDGDRYCCWSRQGTRRDQEGEEGFSSQEEGGKFIHSLSRVRSDGEPSPSVERLRGKARWRDRFDGRRPRVVLSELAALLHTPGDSRREEREKKKSDFFPPPLPRVFECVVSERPGYVPMEVLTNQLPLFFFEN